MVLTTSTFGSWIITTRSWVKTIESKMPWLVTINKPERYRNIALVKRKKPYISASISTCSYYYEAY
jgi:hypothetical protein